MRRITFWLMGTVTILVLLFSYRTSTVGAQAVAPQTSVTQAAAPSSPGTSASGTSPSGGATSSETATSASSSGTYTGDVAQTRWGPVQVAITVASGKITAVDVVQYPNGNGRDEEINAQALPILKQETISAQSAQIDTVSGATVTSDGYLSSLQSAIDKAGLG
ncbi:uncharacterized protein with FMN-binding domain [Branchiibius hedensis]|uniref:Uncharacterized protein, contains FMN-binding domain n=1 Tax=Branchiibius hedensis TaxID=672460 RepID=A0A2Y8ZZ95_9MICO|nr:FMN-binding protein [Branchiibius hedensis]PWJ26758.1 uncharacterized protein with FMN-binding domain [Branchiibius hedensis]SSA35569.1 Uncharacterized protein, contains FMN-binding domain [Branchiibius hedensis]